MNVGVRVAFKHRVFPQRTPGVKTTPEIVETVYAVVGKNTDELTAIIKRHGDKYGAIEWTVSQEFQTQHPIGVRKMHEG
tara:strand:- start:884 stop:1120 length:237 start_codon:yes stop_codon:yes gene_type:complete